ncbi:MAG: CRTAC1 family protein [Gemmatimonadota bacterium]
MTRPTALPLLAALMTIGCSPSGPDASGGDSPSTVTRSGHFSRVAVDVFGADTSSSPSASWADIDADGDFDLYVLNGYASLDSDPEPQQNVLYRNDGGVLTAVADHSLVDEPAFSGSATWGDYDGDGDLDVFVANQRGADNELYRNDGEAGFTRVDDTPATGDGGRSFSAVWVDVDGDGWLDLHVANGRDGDGGGEVDFLYRGGPGGSLTRVRGVPPVEEALRSGGATWADFDGDGDPDLFLPVNTDGEPNRLYRNDGNWRFTEVAEQVGLDHRPLPGSPAASVAHWVDFDADGDLDLFVGNAVGTMDFLYENDGKGRFRKVTAGRLGLDATYVSDAVWADLDNDADLDLAIAVWGGASEIYLNDGTGRFFPADGGDFGSVVNFASSISAEDYDGDGDLDLFLTQWPINEAGGEPNQLYRNDGARGNWLKVDLTGARPGSNTPAIGAVLRVYSGSGDRSERTREAASERERAPANDGTVIQMRHITSRSSWRSAGSLMQHVGLGDAAEVDSIHVTWPSGRAETFGPFPANRRVRLVEGDGR